MTTRWNPWRLPLPAQSSELDYRQYAVLMSHFEAYGCTVIAAPCAQAPWGRSVQIRSPSAGIAGLADPMEGLLTDNLILRSTNRHNDIR